MLIIIILCNNKHGIPQDHLFCMILKGSETLAITLALQQGQEGVWKEALHYVSDVRQVGGLQKETKQASESHRILQLQYIPL